MDPNQFKQLLTHATCLYPEKTVETALKTMALAITQKIAHTNPIMICVLTGGIVPFGKLLTLLNFPLQIDYVHATRYRGKTQGGDIKWKAKPHHCLKGRTVVIIDDILDAGLTLKAIVDYCWDQSASTVYTAVLLDKTETRDPNGLRQADFTGLRIKNQYAVGYGMDYKEYLRNVPGIYAINPNEVTDL